MNPAVHSSEYSPVACIRREAAELYAELFRRKYPAIAERCNGRTERAIEIMTKAGHRQRTDRPGVYLVQSGRDPHKFYEVDTNARTCTCPDTRKNPGIICKHRLAVGLQLQSGEWMIEASRARASACEAARQAMDAAYRKAGELADAYMLLAYQPDATQSQIDAAQHAMLEATDEATRLHAAYTELGSRHISEFIQPA